MENINYFQRIKGAFIKLKGGVTELLKTSDRSTYSHLQNYIYFAHRPIFSFTEAILILCENKKSNAAQVLLRTLFEAHIDIIYHQVENSEQRLAFSNKRMFDENIVILNEILYLIKKYPNLESHNADDLFNKGYLKKAIEYQNECRKAILRANPNLSGTKHLQEKARLCEKGEVKNAEPGYFERMYSVIYRQLSPITHLNIAGFQAFIKQDKYGKNLFHDGDIEDFIATQAVGISVAFVKDLYDNKIIVDKQPLIIKEIETLISEAKGKIQKSLKQ
ncbi:MAG: hypothetical protein HYT93_05200 [Parcubacteria group bacterium]|nr:hypothetical protein [Parcubacteria group bacterium]